MNDCPNAEIRDLLCDAVHGTLGEANCARVDEHVAGCEDCRAELALLHRARAVLSRNAPSVDTARIVAALPPRRAAARGLRFSTWRVAATIAVIAIGAGSLSLVGREQMVAVGEDTAAGRVADPQTLSFSGRLSMLQDEDLEQLLAEIDDFDGGTPEEPAVVLPVPAWDGGTP